MRAGLLAATGELRFMCDADLSMPLSELPRFLAMVPVQCDIAIGSREGIGSNRVGEPAYRHAMGRAFSTLVKAIVLPGINDTQCGFKLFTSNAVEAVFPMTTIAGWAFDVEVLSIARLRGITVKEIPIEWHYRQDSKVSVVRDPIRMFRDLWTIRLNRIRGVYTDEWSGRPGSLLTLAPHRSGRAGSAASGSSTDGFATRRRVPAGPGSQAMATAIPKAYLASSAIRCRDVETGPNLGVLAVFPSTGATCRCPLPSTGSRGLNSPASAVL